MSEVVDVPMEGLNSKYTDEERRHAVLTFALLGNGKQTAKRCGIPQSTFQLWKAQDWFQEMLTIVRKEKEEEIVASLDSVISKANEETLDRLEHGDEYVAKDGELKRIKMKGKDAATIGAIAIDKRQIILNKPTRITQGDGGGMNAMAKEFARLLSKQQGERVVSEQ